MLHIFYFLMPYNELGDNVILKNKVCANTLKNRCVVAFPSPKN